MEKKIYNPFAKGFWKKDNLFNMEAYGKFKSDIEKIKQDKKDTASLENKLSSLGKKLTIGLTIPILLTIFLGVIGLIIGIVIFISIFFVSKK